MAELFTRVQYRVVGGQAGQAGEYETMYSVLSLLSAMLKAPLVRPGTDVVNGAARQRMAVDQSVPLPLIISDDEELTMRWLSFFRALIGLPALTEWETRKAFWA